MRAAGLLAPHNPGLSGFHQLAKQRYELPEAGSPVLNRRGKSARRRQTVNMDL
jgi:hypothetical protein